MITYGLRATAMVAALLAALTSCKGCPRQQPKSEGVAKPAVAATPLTPQLLAPVIRERGLPGELPELVMIELGRAAMPEGALGKSSGATRVTVTPKLGTVVLWETESSLAVKPTEPMAYDTEYKLSIQEIETRTGAVKSPGTWEYTFKTAPFQIVRVGLHKVTGGSAEVDVVFAGPVRAAAVTPFLGWTVDGATPKVTAAAATDRKNVVRAKLTGRSIRPGATITLAARAGAPSLAKGVVAPAAEEWVILPGGEPMKILSSRLREGESGFYVEVLCDDEAVKGEKVHHWDPVDHESRKISRRCVLSAEEVARAVRTSPPVKLSVAPGSAGFRLFGEFQRGPVALTIDAGVRTEEGGVLLEAFQKTFSVPARRPSVGFATGGRYLPRSAWRSLPVSHVNVDEVALTVRQVPPENLLFWLGEDQDERATERTSDVLLQKTHRLSSPQDRQITTWIDVASMLPATTKGVLELTVTGDKARATARILLTNMNLVAKRSAVPKKEAWRQEVRVWALDIDSTEPLSGVEMTLVRKSGKVLARCTTGGDAGCTLQSVRDDADDAAPFAILARKGDDLTYIRYADLETDTSDADVAGESFGTEIVYRASVWSERGVYRPGDQAHLSAIVRDREHRAPPAGMPVELHLIDPKEKLVRKLALKTNEAGFVTADVRFDAFADTGRYEAQAMAGGRRIGGHAFNVEEFVPERMKVQARAEGAGYVLGESAKVSVDARYLFGGSAEGAPVEVSCALEPAEFRPTKENAQFTYGPRPRRAMTKPISLGAVRGAIDARGHASMACPPGVGAFSGPARLVASAAVFEAGSGRSSVADARAPFHPERFYLGLQTGARRAEVGKQFTVRGVVVDWAGGVQTGVVRSIEVELVRLEAEFGWWWDEEEGREQFQRHLRPVSEGKRPVAVEQGRFSVDLKPTERGAAYLVRVAAGKALTELELEGESGGWYWRGDQRDQTPRPLKATSLTIEGPRSLRVGRTERMKVSFPFRGRALFTVETDRVLSAEWRKVEPGETTWPVKVSSFAPNAYVSVLLVKDPHLESAQAFMPDRAFGVVSVPVEPTDFTTSVAIVAPKEVRSARPFTVELDVGKTEGPTYAVVAAVDEGILQLTRMKSPDPTIDLFPKRALGVDTFETIGWTLLMRPQGPSRPTGGDAGAGDAGRVQPVKPVALWSGLVTVGRDGKAKVKFEVPQYRGQLRVMAVVASAKRVGHASVDVTVKDPLVLSTTLPRFAIKDDLLQIPVFVTNMSGAPQDVSVTLQAEALPVPGIAPSPLPVKPLVFVGRSEGTAKLANGSSTTLVFQVKAAVAVGAARLRVTARAGPHESREELDVPFLPAGARERIVKRIEVEEKEIDLKPHLAGWVPTSERSTFWLTGNPYGESFDHLKYLVHYPYGCVEQTTSSARPLLFVANLLDSVDPALTVGGKIEEMVNSGVQRILSMQTPSGGLAYWPGSSEPYAWGTAYATHFLLDAQKLGHAVPQDRLDDILKWIEGETGRLERGERSGRNWYDDGRAEPYLHYVLALAGKGHKARIQRLIDRPSSGTRQDGEAAEQKYMLQAALYLAGDRRYEAELRRPDLSPVTDERRNSWSFYSDRRRRGFMLSTFQDLFGNDPAGEPLAQLVASSLSKPSGYFTTQELVWSVTGLGKRVGTSARDAKPGRLVANGKVLEPRPTKGRAGDRTWALARASEYDSVRLKVDEPGTGRLFLIVSSEGVREKPEARFGGAGLKISRVFKTLDGTEVDPGAGASLADVLFVQIKLRNTTPEAIQNVVLVDRIPAGFEIENPRLGRGKVVSWVDTDRLWAPDYLDVRDHQMAVFGKLPPGEVEVVYAVRAVTSGRFTLPPVEAEAMYDPRIWARHAGGSVQVTGPWTDLL